MFDYFRDVMRAVSPFASDEIENKVSGEPVIEVGASPFPGGISFEDLDENFENEYFQECFPEETFLGEGFYDEALQEEELSEEALLEEEREFQISQQQGNWLDRYLDAMDEWEEEEDES